MFIQVAYAIEILCIFAMLYYEDSKKLGQIAWANSEELNCTLFATLYRLNALLRCETKLFHLRRINVVILSFPNYFFNLYGTFKMFKTCWRTDVIFTEYTVGGTIQETQHPQTLDFIIYSENKTLITGETSCLFVLLKPVGK